MNLTSGALKGYSALPSMVPLHLWAKQEEVLPNAPLVSDREAASSLG